MNKILGLDLGTNSIGWALIESNQIIEFGARVFPAPTHIKSIVPNKQVKTLQKQSIEAMTVHKQKSKGKTSRVFILLIVCALLNALLSVINIRNWQFWLNLSLTTFIAALSLLHQNEK
ncbi:MAG: hypothetical protein K9G70_13905 [Prolixibacteraceae bacterium]|nr:hypothetical protein [Prolixibacteraceae bacterium]